MDTLNQQSVYTVNFISNFTQTDHFILQLYAHTAVEYVDCAMVDSREL